MTFKEFDEFQAHILAEVVRMKDTKGKEYAHSEDRFANFNRLAIELNMPNYLIGYIYFKKHLDSIVSYINNLREFSDEGIEGRFVDAITYLTLIAGMLKDPGFWKKPESTTKTAIPTMSDTYKDGEYLPCITIEEKNG